MKAGLFTLCLLALASSARADALVTLDRAHPGPALNGRLLGVNMGVWEDIDQPSHAGALKALGASGVRWPGGSTADLYHWADNKACPGGYANGSASFEAFLDRIVKPLALDLWMTVDYGTDETCSGGGDAAEAGAWVAAAKAKGVEALGWTVGNEAFGDWEIDRHAQAHDPETYAKEVAQDFYPAIKAADPQAKVGIVVAPEFRADWDAIVLAKARYDFVEVHFYAQQSGKEDDVFLAAHAADALKRNLAVLRGELARAGRVDTPIFVGEINSVNTGPGKQTMGIAQALFAGQALGAMMEEGVAAAAWWSAFGSCTLPPHGNFSANLAGDSPFGGYMLAADERLARDCPQAAALAPGALTPAGRAFQMMNPVLRAGARPLKAGVTGEASVRAYASATQEGEAVALFNLDPSRATPVRIALARPMDARIETMDGAVSAARGDSVAPLALILAPWSMALVRLKAR